ncbi:MAG: hypothetical protein ACYSWZ_21505 [Planctomycetota bacterium]|jgi:hypothetical protein
MTKWTLGQLGKQSQLKPIKANKSQLKPIKANSNPIQTQNKPNSNPTCRGVASGVVGNKANFKGKNIWFLWLLFGVRTVQSNNYRIYVVNP